MAKIGRKLVSAGQGLVNAPSRVATVTQQAGNANKWGDWAGKWGGIGEATARKMGDPQNTYFNTGGKGATTGGIVGGLLGAAVGGAFTGGAGTAGGAMIGAGLGAGLGGYSGVQAKGAQQLADMNTEQKAKDDADARVRAGQIASLRGLWGQGDASSSARIGGMLGQQLQANTQAGANQLNSSFSTGLDSIRNMMARSGLTGSSAEQSLMQDTISQYLAGRSALGSAQDQARLGAESELARAREASVGSVTGDVGADRDSALRMQQGLVQNSALMTPYNNIGRYLQTMAGAYSQGAQLQAAQGQQPTGADLWNTALGGQK